MLLLQAGLSKVISLRIKSLSAIPTFSRICIQTQAFLFCFYCSLSLVNACRFHWFFQGVERAKAYSEAYFWFFSHFRLFLVNLAFSIPCFYQSKLLSVVNMF